MIELKNISKTYHSLNGETTILKDVSFVLPTSGFVALCGKSGCGKTTLFNIISGIDRDYVGDILYDNIDLKSLNKIDREQFINNNVFYLKSRDNFIKNIKVSEAIYIYLSQDKREEAVKLIKQLEIESLLNKTIKKLSSGELQKISLIIAICKKAKITLLDEPICNIDEASVHSFLNLIKELSKSSLVIYISHYEDDFDSYFSNILYLDHCKIVTNKSEISKSFENNNKSVSTYNFKKSLLIEKSKPTILYILFRLIICVVICFIIYVSKLRAVSVASIYSSSVSDMSVNIVNANRNTNSDLLTKKRIYYSLNKSADSVYFDEFQYGYTDISGFGKASDFIFANFNESLMDNEIIISDYLAYEQKANVGDEVTINKIKYNDNEMEFHPTYVIKYIYKTNYASLLLNDEKIPEEYSYVYISDSEMDEMIDVSLNSYGGIYLNDYIFVSSYDEKLLDCNYYDASGFNIGYKYPEDDEFYAGTFALSKLGLSSINQDSEKWYHGSDEYYSITFSYNGLSITKKMKYKKFVSELFGVVVSENVLNELKSYFGIISDNVLNYKEVTTLDTKNSNIDSFFKDFTSFNNMTFVNDEILSSKYSNINTLNTFYNENFVYILLFFSVFLILGSIRIIQIELEYSKLLKQKNFGVRSRVEMFLSSKLVVYAIIFVIITILSHFIVAV